MSGLESRYRRLIRLYPADYRRQRGEEIVTTYLETVKTKRRWPRPADVTDVVAGSVRQRARAADPLFVGGLRAAAVLALTGASALAAIWFFHVELTRQEYAGALPAVGPFRTLGGPVWLCWLAAAVVVAWSPGRYSRWAVVGALAATQVVVPVSALTPYDRPALMALVPHTALGLVALGLDARASRAARFLPVAAVAVTTLALLLPVLPHSSRVSGGYRFEAEHLMPATGALLMIAGLVTAVALRARGLWTLALLALPVALCFTEPAARRISGKRPWNPADFHDLVTASIGLAVLAVAVALTLRLAARRRTGRYARSGGDLPRGAS